jgi:hypothetical protein
LWNRMEQQKILIPTAVNKNLFSVKFVHRLFCKENFTLLVSSSALGEITYVVVFFVPFSSKSQVIMIYIWMCKHAIILFNNFKFVVVF